MDLGVHSVEVDADRAHPQRADSQGQRKRDSVVGFATDPADGQRGMDIGGIENTGVVEDSQLTRSTVGESGVGRLDRDPKT